MKKYVRIESGVVAECLETAGDITRIFHPSMVWVDVTGLSVQPLEGWRYAAGEFSPAPSLSDVMQ